jgi:S-formylglutathione hydrolase
MSVRSPAYSSILLTTRYEIRIPRIFALRNFTINSGIQLAFIAPDTSPRGAGVEGESENWDFGVGAGFYVDATESKWAHNYRMYSYVTVELIEVVREHFKALDVDKRSICGHSMGGHGALTIALKNNAFRYHF